MGLDGTRQAHRSRNSGPGWRLLLDTSHQLPSRPGHRRLPDAAPMLVLFGPRRDLSDSPIGLFPFGILLQRSWRDFGTRNTRLS